MEGLGGQTNLGNLVSSNSGPREGGGSNGGSKETPRGHQANPVKPRGMRGKTALQESRVRGENLGGSVRLRNRSRRGGKNLRSLKVCWNCGHKPALVSAPQLKVKKGVLLTRYPMLCEGCFREIDNEEEIY